MASSPLSSTKWFLIWCWCCLWWCRTSNAGSVVAGEAAAVAAAMEVSPDGECAAAAVVEEEDDDEPAGVCEDLDDRCPQWAGEGECLHNPSFMMAACQKSCTGCGSTLRNGVPVPSAGSSGEDCKDWSEHCKDWARKGECDANPFYMFHRCPRSCYDCGDDDDEIQDQPGLLLPEDGSDLGVPQTLWEHKDHAQKRIVRMRRHVREHPSSSCSNQHADCTIRALGGDCHNHPSFMKKECAPACFSCEHQKKPSLRSS